MNTQSNTFCILPWIHIYANADGNVLPCCIADYRSPLGNLNNESVIEVWNGERYKELRKNMLEGNRSKECSACYEVEDRGISSFRQNANIDYKKYLDIATETNPDGSLNDLSLRYFDIRWSNICNFRCRSCSGTYSSSLAKEENRQKTFIFAGGNSNDNLYSQFLPYFKDVEQFYFAGGEPLLMDKHYDILNHLISIGKTDVNLSYNTNISTIQFKGTPITELWNKFSSVKVSASLDSWGPRAEYIRHGTDWKTIERNIKVIQDQSPHVNLQTNTVVSVFNLYTLPEFISYLTDTGIFNISTFDPCFYNILNPEFYSANVIPDSLKEKIIEHLQSANFGSNINQKLKEVITYLKTSEYKPELHYQFKRSTDYYDNLRNQNFINTFPELNELYRQ